jgi:PAS domain S-box-containing protein
MKNKTYDTYTQQQDQDNIYRMVFENANDGIIIHDTYGNIYDINATMHRRLGYSKEEMLEMNLNDLVAPGFDEKIRERTVDLEQQGVAIFESADRRKDGTIMPVEVSARYFEHNGAKMIQSIVRDIQERKTAEALIQTSMNERAILGAEAKHSVRFNQAICNQMLERLSFLSESGVHSLAMENQIRRIKAVTFLQEKVYAYSSITRIDLKEIATSLIRHLYTLYQVDPKKTTIHNRVQTMHLDLHQTALCSYIMIELLSNALRHAFPDGRSGEVSVTSALTKGGKHKLCVRDNGVGFPENFDIHTAKSFGLSLVNEQVEELAGKLSHRRSGKTVICIHF